MNDSYEELWDIIALHMPPADWMKLTPEVRAAVVQEAVDKVGRFRAGLSELGKVLDADQRKCWLGHVGLYASFFEYHLHRLDSFAQVYDQIFAHRDALNRPEGLPEDVADSVLGKYAEIYDWAAKYDAAMQNAPDGMLTRCRWMTKPYQEWMAGYDQWLDGQLEIKQFVGNSERRDGYIAAWGALHLASEAAQPGRVPLGHRAGQRIELTGDVAKLGLPARAGRTRVNRWRRVTDGPSSCAEQSPKSRVKPS